MPEWNLPRARCSWTAFVGFITKTTETGGPLTTIEARTALPTAPLFLTLGLGLVPPRRPPLLATPIATPLQGGRPERSGLLFLKLLEGGVVEYFEYFEYFVVGGGGRRRVLLLRPSRAVMRTWHSHRDDSTEVI